jgi:hypothetical protein
MTSKATGPRTDDGKERSSLNATKHGLRSERPVLPTEDADEWDAFRADIVATLAPANTIERELAERVALQMWRQRRAARYEVEVCADEYEGSALDSLDALHGVNTNGAPQEAMQKLIAVLDARMEIHAGALDTLETARNLATMPADAAIDEGDSCALLVSVGAEKDDAFPLTAGALRRAMARVSGKTEAEALALAVLDAEEYVQECALRIAETEEQKKRWGELYQRRMLARMHDQKLLQKTALDRVVRYEAHVSRQLEQALRLLRQFQAERREREAEARRVEPVPVRSVETVVAPPPMPEAIARRAQLPPVEPSSFGSSHETPSREEAAPLPVDVDAEFVRQFAGGKHNGTAVKEAPRESS